MAFISSNAASQLQLNHQNNNLSALVTTTPNMQNNNVAFPLMIGNAHQIPNISSVPTILTTTHPNITGLNPMNNINNIQCLALNNNCNMRPVVTDRSTSAVPTAPFIVQSIPNINISPTLNTITPFNAMNALSGCNINQNYQIHNNHSIILLNSGPNLYDLNQSAAAMLPPSTMNTIASKPALPEISTNNAFISASGTTNSHNIQKLECDEAATSSKENSSWVCKICAKSFLHECNLKIHSIIHTDKALHCGFCNKAFARASNLDQHLRVHTNYRPWNCTHCSKSFRQKHSLKDHLRTHTGERPFKCHYCPRAFKVKHNLVTHTRLHTGERPFECSVCPKRFASKSSLNGHIRQKHPAIWKKQKSDSKK